MNERLTELYRASRPKEALASQDEFKSANALLGSDVEKFAELIIRECILQAEKEEDRFLEMSEVDLAYSMQNFQLLLKNYFGVEE